jgi:hypothetical protein
MQASLDCPQCHQRVESGDRFCVTCGARLFNSRPCIRPGRVSDWGRYRPHCQP